MRFEYSRLKVERAEKHIIDIQSAFDKFIETQYYPFIGNSDSDRGNKTLEFIRTARIPAPIPFILGDAVHNIRTSLDLMVNQVQKGSGLGYTETAKLHFRNTRDELVGTVNKFIKVFSPVLADFIINVIKPYRGGNDFLYTLHDLDIMDKHRLIIPTMAMTKGIVTVESNEGFQAASASYSCAITLSGEIYQTSIPDNLTIKNYRSRTVDIFFDQGLPVESKPIIPTLHEFVEMVLGILDSAERLALW